MLLAAVVLVGKYASAADIHRPKAIDELRLEDALARYRSIEQEGGWPTVPDGPVLEPGAVDARVVILRRRLSISGDLIHSQDDPNYDAAVVRAVERFQSRHGLAVDGRVGRATLATLNRPAAERIAQLEINLDRLRALPDPPPTYIRINTASAFLEVMDQDSPVMRMPVIVGDPRHPTPAFQSSIVAVVFNPPWNIPRSITVKEILPRLRRDPNYLASQDIHIVGRPADPFGRTVNWRAIAGPQFPFSLRQVPGPRNALGLIKFEVPNPFDIYLHDTPEKTLFNRPVRAFSHGCIRLSRPRELATFLLAQQDWSADAIDAAIATGTTRRAAIERPISVYVVYMTAFVDQKGRVEFRDDIYGRDAAILADRSEGKLNHPIPASLDLAEAPRIGCGNSG